MLPWCILYTSCADLQYCIQTSFLDMFDLLTLQLLVLFIVCQCPSQALQIDLVNDGMLILLADPESL